jgi:hypothetical protein
MKPVDALGNSGLLFKCIMTAEEVLADKREAARKDAEPLQFAPSEENRARCTELRDQMNQAPVENKGKSLNELRDTAIAAENLQREAETLQCWSKP